MSSPVAAMCTATESFWAEKVIHVRADQVALSYSEVLSLLARSQRELLEEVLCATIVEEQRCDEIPRSDCPTARRRPWS